MSTANVVVSRTGTNWTVDVTVCNFDTNLGIKDFVVLQNGVVASTTFYTKTTPTVLTYTGVALAANTTVEVRRKTPTTVISPITYAARFSSTLWNAELERKTRWQEEVDLNGAGSSAGVLPTPKDDAFSTLWDGDIVYPPTRNAVHDKIVTLAPLVNPTFTTPSSSTSPTLNDSSGLLATTNWTQQNLSLKANVLSPNFAGSPTAPTAPHGTATAQLATTSFVSFSNQPAWCVSVGLANQTFSTTLSQLPLTSVFLDSEAGAFAGSQFQVPPGKGGWFVMGFSLYLQKDSTAGSCATHLQLNSSTILRQDVYLTSSTQGSCSGVLIYNLVPGDVVRVAIQTSAGAVTVGSADTSLTKFWGFRLF